MSFKALLPRDINFGSRTARQILNQVRQFSRSRECDQEAKLESRFERRPEDLDVSPSVTAKTNKLDMIDPARFAPIPTYQVMKQDGSFAGEPDPDLKPEVVIELYKQMTKLNVFDNIMFNCHRQGRISFYMTSFGEEALQFGSAAALKPEDWIFAQYREPGPLIFRGMSFRLLIAQCYGHKEDLGKGRQMPIHYGNRALNYVTISSPLTTQLPQATGAAYSFKLDKSGRIVICYFGEGAASEGDAHTALNFAATLSCPVIFLCRNNGYAISTPASEQYSGDGIASRAIGYGMKSIRVDGNDLFAMYSATKLARKICTQESRPVLIEAMTYRVGHHSTSDDSSAYRSNDEVRQWEMHESPIKRIYNYLKLSNLWSEDQQNCFEDGLRKEIIDEVNRAEKVKKLPISTMFDDVYHDLPFNLQRQRDELNQHLDKFGQHYKIDQHEC